MIFRPSRSWVLGLVPTRCRRFLLSEAAAGSLTGLGFISVAEDLIFLAQFCDPDSTFYIILKTSSNESETKLKIKKSSFLLSERAWRESSASPEHVEERLEINFCHNWIPDPLSLSWSETRSGSLRVSSPSLKCFALEQLRRFRGLAYLYRWAIKQDWHTPTHTLLSGGSTESARWGLVEHIH